MELLHTFEDRSPQLFAHEFDPLVRHPVLGGEFFGTVKELFDAFDLGGTVDLVPDVEL